MEQGKQPLENSSAPKVHPTELRFWFPNSRTNPADSEQQQQKHGGNSLEECPYDHIIVLMNLYDTEQNSSSKDCCKYNASVRLYIAWVTPFPPLLGVFTILPDPTRAY